MKAPRTELLAVRGWRAEFKCWWKMAKHVNVVFDRTSHSQNQAHVNNAGPGSISMCRACCQILSTRTCSGSNTDTALGCDYHRAHPDVPIAIRSTITSVRLREMFKPNMQVQSYYLEPGKTDLMHLHWVGRLRSSNKETKRSKKVYVHEAEAGCLHSDDPESILQGLGPRGIYFKRCDGRFVNAFGEELEISQGEGESENDDEPNSLPEQTKHVLQAAHGEAVTSAGATPVADQVPSAQAEAAAQAQATSQQPTASQPEEDEPWSFARLIANIQILEDAPASTDPEITTTTTNDEDTPFPSTAAENAAVTSSPTNSDDNETSIAPTTSMILLTLPPTSTPSSTPSIKGSSTTDLSLSSKHRIAPLPRALDIDEAKLAELAWRRHNPHLAADEEAEADEKKKRRLHCIVM